MIIGIYKQGRNLTLPGCIMGTASAYACYRETDTDQSFGKSRQQVYCLEQTCESNYQKLLKLIRIYSPLKKQPLELAHQNTTFILPLLKAHLHNDGWT